MSTPRRRLLAALVAGALVPFAFAPFGLFPLAVLLPAVLFFLWLDTTPREAARLGFVFGLGMFGVGVSWIYFSLHDFGNMPAPLAAMMVLLLVTFLAGYPALLGALQARVASRGLRLVAFLPAAWVLLEWMRGWILTGFPWLSLGYSQIASPLAGLAPVAGVYGVGYAVVLSAALFVQALRAPGPVRYLLPLVMLWLGAFALGRVQWVEPVDGPIRASLVQANVPIEIKWQPQWRNRIIELYTRLTLENKESQLIVWPETAVPGYLHELDTGDLVELRRQLAGRDPAVLFGVVERIAGNPHPRMYNSVASLAAQPGVYRKQHLVPFGEFLPLSDVLSWLLNYLHIPMSNFNAWGTPQPPLRAAGQKVAVSICYEDVFGEEIIRGLPAATLLVNVSEDAWFGDSLAPHQHLEMARMRAVEGGRTMLRATNTGVSAIIDHRGRVITAAPQFKTEVVSASVQPMRGATPYVRWGNWPVVVILGLAAFAAWRAERR